MERRYQVVETRTSEDKLRPGAAFFQYQGRVTQEDADITAEALYDEFGHVRATRDHWKIRRFMEPDPHHAARALGHYPGYQPAHRGVVAQAFVMLFALLGIVVGAAFGGVAGAVGFGAPGMLLGAAIGGWAGGACAIAMTR